MRAEGKQCANHGFYSRGLEYVTFGKLEDLESSVYTIVPTYLQFRFLQFPAVQKWMILLMMNRQQFGSGPTLCHSAYIIHLTTSRKHFIMAQERKVFGDEEWDLKLAAHSLWRQQEAQARCSLGALSSLLLLAFEEGRGSDLMPQAATGCFFKISKSHRKNLVWVLVWEEELVEEHFSVKD